MKYSFHTTYMTLESPGIYKPLVLDVFALDETTALDLVLPQVPSGHRIWLWHEDPAGACTMCGGPFHPATGHWESEKRHWCGVCSRSMVKLYRDMQNRRWGGVRFYDHAFVPSGDTT
jgi:hypothetical protein